MCFYESCVLREAVDSFTEKDKLFSASDSFCLLQSHSWPGNSGHLCAQASGLGHLFDRPGCLLGAFHTDQYSCGTSADKPFPASGKLVLAGELGPPVYVPGVCTDDLLSLIVGVVL